MKKFFWKTFIQNMGGKLNFAKFVITIIFTIACIIWVIFDKGLNTCLLLLLEGMLIDNIKEFIKTTKKTNDEYTIETNDKR